MSCSFFLKYYGASLIWTPLQRNTVDSPGMLLGRRAHVLMVRDSCEGLCPATSSQGGDPHVLSSRTSPGPGGVVCACRGSNGGAPLSIVTSHQQQTGCNGSFFFAAGPLPSPDLSC